VFNIFKTILCDTDGRLEVFLYYTRNWAFLCIFCKTVLLLCLRMTKGKAYLCRIISVL